MHLFLLLVSQLIFSTMYVVDCQRGLTEIGPTSFSFSVKARRTLLKGLHRLLVTKPHNRVSTKWTGLGREHEPPSQEFLVVGTVVGSCLISLQVPVPKGHQTPFIGMVVILQSAIAVQT